MLAEEAAAAEAETTVVADAEAAAVADTAAALTAATAGALAGSWSTAAAATAFVATVADFGASAGSVRMNVHVEHSCEFGAFKDSHRVHFHCPAPSDGEGAAPERGIVQREHDAAPATF